MRYAFGLAGEAPSPARLQDFSYKIRSQVKGGRSWQNSISTARSATCRWRPIRRSCGSDRPARGVAQSGACSVHINGEVRRSCSVSVSTVKPTDRIVTIEGLSATSSNPVQKAWAALDVPQCGYCQSGQIMAATALLRKNPNPTDADIDAAMTNICRCGTYQRIRAGVHMAADMAKKA